MFFFAAASDHAADTRDTDLARQTYNFIKRNLPDYSVGIEQGDVQASGHDDIADGQALSDIFNEIIYHKDVSALIDSGHLTPAIYTNVRTGRNFSALEVSRTTFDFVEDSVAAIVNTPAFHEIVAGISAKSLTGYTTVEERTQMLADFAEGKFSVLIGSLLLVESANMPSNRNKSFDSAILHDLDLSEDVFPIAGVGSGGKVRFEEEAAPFHALDGEDPFSQDSPAGRKARRMSRYAWVCCGTNQYVLPISKEDRISISLEDGTFDIKWEGRVTSFLFFSQKEVVALGSASDLHAAFEAADVILEENMTRSELARYVDSLSLSWSKRLSQWVPPGCNDSLRGDHAFL
ncbi:hypothetical protein QFC22_005967 [Naganishia vaughanmartiniae]|uniref:Uncharacterized protein n=1 Tax=Naganishia vaughanmartiniae TaxID=1424756 RepID=A0ACC2WQH5_9TREE|nr:hypothetical protein QFC22_005967 [Naganishia vaughanmartiniae]